MSYEPFMEAPHALPKSKRPFLFTLICLFAGVYYLTLAALFITGFSYSGRVADAINLYASVTRFSKTEMSLILGLMSALFILTFSGIILMFKMRRYGYYIFGISSLLLAAIRLFRPVLSFSGPAVLIVFLILFGLYFRRFR